MRTIALLAALVLAAAGSGAAQVPTDQAMQAAAVLGAPAPVASLPVAGNLPPRKFSSRAPGATLMIVGGACLLAGILVGGDGGTVLILAGIGIGAYGVYLYTQ